MEQTTQGEIMQYIARNLLLTSFNLRTYTQIHTPTVVQGGGGMEPLPGVFDMFQYFETILPLVESL